MTGIIVDLFAGGGGASEAIFMATGRHPDIAVNHDQWAVDLHRANHPNTKHYCCDVHEVDPEEACAGRPVDLLWASPDCTHHSKARGGKPAEKKIRALAWVVVKWAAKVKPTMIFLENVEEFQDWGDLDENGRPIKELKGETFRLWNQAFIDLGYKTRWGEIVAANHGAPTTRKRLFWVARRDGKALAWPGADFEPRAKATIRDLFDEPKEAWRSAADHVIDWSIPVPSIFDRKKPLASKTRRRIARGVKRYVIDAQRPFIVPITHTGSDRLHDLDDPLKTVTAANRGEFSLVAPSMLRTDMHQSNAGCFYDPNDALRTITSHGGHALAAAHLTKFSENSIGTDLQDPLHTAMAGAPRHGLVAAYLGRQFGSTVSGRDIEEPHPTVVTDGAGAKSQVVAAYMDQHNGDRIGRSASEPVTTLTHRATQQKLAAVALDKYYQSGTPADVQEPLDTATAKARFGLNAAYIEQANTGMVGHHADDPISTIVGKGCTQRPVVVRLENLDGEPGSRRRQVVEFLWEHFGTPTASEWADPLGTPAARLKFGLVVLDDVVWQIADIGMRMLVPRELYNAQGFRRDYIIDLTWDGRPITKTAQTRMAGNSVSPPPAAALIRANLHVADDVESEAA